MQRIILAMTLFITATNNTQAGGSSFEESLAKQIAALQRALLEKQAQAKEKK